MTITITDWESVQSPCDRGLKIQVKIDADTDEEGEMLKTFFKTLTDVDRLASSLIEEMAECGRIMKGIDSALFVYNEMIKRVKG
jgi:hypothetical protein